MELAEKISVVLLGLMLLPLIAVVGPQGLAAALGAAVVVGMAQLGGPREPGR